MNTILYPTAVFECSTKKTILDKAREAVEVKPRHYGSPLKNHGRCAELWSIYLKNRGHHLPMNLVADDFCMMMILFKLCRYMEGKDLDSLVDIAGYARNLEIIKEERDGQQASSPQEGVLQQEIIPK